MSNVPLPRPGPLGLIQYAGVDMQEYAAAVSAEKDAEIERLRAEVAGLQIKADLFDLAVRKGLLSVHSELIDPRNHGTRCSWLEGHAKACDISNNAALAARKGTTPTTPPPSPSPRS